MRHGKKFNHLSRTSAHRRAMLSNMAASLILHKRIMTTVAKAKALRIYVEPLITKSKEDTTHSRRMVFSYLQSKDAVTELFREVSTKVANRPGGYTRIIKMANRLGDNAEMCMMELVDYNTLLLGSETPSGKTAAKRRRRGSGKGTASEETTVTAAKAKKEVAEVKKEEKVEEVLDSKVSETETDLAVETNEEEKKTE